MSCPIFVGVVVNIEAILAEPQQYIGQTIEFQGYFIGLREGNDYIAYLGSDADVPDADKQQIRIAQPFAEIKRIISPLVALQLLYRGSLTNPPYYYRFPIHLTARVEMNGLDSVVLQDISFVTLQIPYSGKTAELSPYASYEYSATVDYAPQREPESKMPTKAKILAKRALILKESQEDVLQLSAEENRYARWSVGQNLKIGGWLRFWGEDKNGQAHLVLRTFALRASMLSLGPMKEMTSIWLRPAPYYEMLRAHMPISPENELNQRVDIIGKIDYLQEEIPAIDGELLPKLVFTDISAVTIYEENYLLES